MALGKISTIKSEEVGYISSEGRSEIKFHRTDFSGEWDRETIVGKKVSFFPSTDANGAAIAVSVRIVA